MTQDSRNNLGLGPIPQPHPALKRLEKLVGTWVLTGRTLDARDDNISGWTTFEWMLGGFFLKATGEINFVGQVVQSVEIIAYDEAHQAFLSNVYSNLSGSVLPYQWDIQGNSLLHWMETSKYTGTFSEDGNTITGGWRPNEGTPATDGATYDAVMTRTQ
jgi:hypothetical protein